MQKVEVVAHDPQWQVEFAAEAQKIARALGENAAAVHHIGSTSIPNIYAKPVIDILVEVKTITEVDQNNPAMAALGYEALGEYGIAGRRYFRKDNAAGIRTHHVHTFEKDSENAARHLAFRDFLRAHPTDAQQYSELKQKLAQEFPHDIEAYMDGKDAFIKQTERRAIVWRQS